MPGLWGQNLQNNLNIDKQIIHNLAHLLYSNGNRSCSHIVRVTTTYSMVQFNILTVLNVPL